MQPPGHSEGGGGTTVVDGGGGGWLVLCGGAGGAATGVGTSTHHPFKQSAMMPDVDVTIRWQF